MPRTTNKKKAEANKTLWDRANGSTRQQWRSKQQKALDFYLNDQLTEDEQRMLEESGMPTFTINRVTPVIEIMKFFVTAKSPRWQAVASEGSDTDIAAIHSDIADYCWNLSDGGSLYSHIIQDALTRGVGYFMLDIDPDADRGMGEVLFKKVDPFDVYVDPSSRDFLFRDASYIIIKKDLPKSQLLTMMPEHSLKINKAKGQPQSEVYTQRNPDFSQNIQPDDIGGQAYLLDGSEDEIIDYYEVYTKVKVAYMNLFMKVPQNIQQVEELKRDLQNQLHDVKREATVALKERQQKIDAALENGDIIPERAALEKKKAERETAEMITQREDMLKAKLKELKSQTTNQIVTEKEFKILIENEQFKESLLDAIKFYDERVHLSCSLSSDIMLYEYVLPINEYPIVPIPYMYTNTPYPMSAVSPLIGKQQEINKAHQIMVHNANLGSNLRWMYEEGSVPEEEWEQYSSSPGALLKYRQGFQPPTPVMPATLNSAFFSITQEGKQDMEYMSGIYSSMQGAPTQQHDTYRGMLTIDEYGTRRVKAWMQTIVEPSLTHLGKVFQQLSQATYTAQKVFRITQPSGLQEDRQVEINVPIWDDMSQAITKFHDYASARFDVKVIGGSTLPVNRWALLEEYFRWYQSGLIDDIAMLAQTDIRGKEKIMERKSVYSQLKSQVENLEKALKDTSGENDTLKRQIVQAGIRHGVDVGQGEMDKEFNMTKAQQKMLRGFMQNEFDMAKKELGMKVDTAVSQFKAGMSSVKKEKSSS
ncbi:hypothetical protein CMI47_21790 [Candidatus Pacearchaeota archaeon]|nr:hypothetical protein [Candidatus Pacearchaeota archaeon]